MEGYTLLGIKLSMGISAANQLDGKRQFGADVRHGSSAKLCVRRYYRWCDL